MIESSVPYCLDRVVYVALEYGKDPVSWFYGLLAGVVISEISDYLERKGLFIDVKKSLDLLFSSKPPE